MQQQVSSMGGTAELRMAQRKAGPVAPIKAILFLM